MYQWIVFIHIASVLGLLLVHPVTIAFYLKEERNDTRIRELLEVSEAASTLRWIFFGLTIASGLVLGFMGSFWGTMWIWAALVIFVAIGLVMNLTVAAPSIGSRTRATTPRWSVSLRASAQGSSPSRAQVVCCSSCT